MRMGTPYYSYRKGYGRVHTSCVLGRRGPTARPSAPGYPRKSVSARPVCGSARPAAARALTRRVASLHSASRLAHRRAGRASRAFGDQRRAAGPKVTRGASGINGAFLAASASVAVRRWRFPAARFSAARTDRCGDQRQTLGRGLRRSESLEAPSHPLRRPAANAAPLRSLAAPFGAPAVHAARFGDH
jgi:hypothetical protein